MTDKYTLITNLEWVTVNGIRTFTHALLVSDSARVFSNKQRHLQLRGFHVCPASPVFDLDVPTTAFTLIDAHSADVMVMNDEGLRPLYSGAIMQMESGLRMLLVVSDRRQPLDVRTFEGERSILQAWDVLPMLVRRYWTAPNMPTLQWGPR